MKVTHTVGSKFEIQTQAQLCLTLFAYHSVSSVCVESAVCAPVVRMSLLSNDLFMCIHWQIYKAE